MGRRDRDPKKRKKDPNDPDAKSDSEESDKETEADKYRPFKVKDYCRKYPETSERKDFVVFLKHQVDQKPFSDNDKVALSQALRKHAVSGVLHLRPVNRYKVAITFDLSNNANMFLSSKILDELTLYASIPASGTEITGVVKSVPVNLSNKKIFSLIGSSRNVVQVRRFMRKRVEGGQVSYTPTQTVAVTFASTQLPEHVFLDSWRHEVAQYVPPVKQCLKCLQFEHIASYCKNNDVCSICSRPHNFKVCNEDKNKKPICVNCKGDHVAISAACPIKKAKIEENKIKSHSATYSALFDEKSFPHLAARNSNSYFQNIIKSKTFLNMITQVIVKLVSNKQNEEVPINTETIRAAFQDTISERVHSTN
ncbi:hypothetical protein NE865_14476 [Phthorimaea operculella]|nr:hypothetical protein NE865_14476 [Phthorimaea operculella]